MSSLREVYTRKQRITEAVSIIKNVSSFRPHIEFISYFCVHILLFLMDRRKFVVKAKRRLIYE